MTIKAHNEGMRSLILTLPASGLLAASAVGCAGDPANPSGNDPFDGNPVGDDDDGGDDDDAVGTSMHAIVRDAQGQPVAGATVAISGTTATTDENGRAMLSGLSADVRGLVSVRKSGYAKTQVPFEIVEGIENALLITLAEVDFVGSFAAGDGLSFQIEDGGPSVELPAGGFVDASGNAYAGTVNVEATFYDLTSAMDDGNEILAVPGDFTAVDATGADQSLESYGMFQVNLTDGNGNELNLASTSSAPVVMPLQGSGYEIGEQIAAWSYDEALGKWVEEGVGTVVQLDDGRLGWQFTAPHFSTWNCDRPLPTHGCVTGTIRNGQGTPRQGATVRAVGITYIATTTARTDANGQFCLEVKNGETVWMEISYSVGGQVATQRTDAVTIPAGQASCSLGSQTCIDIGVVQMDIMSCISGIVINGQGQPVQGVQVRSSAGGTAVTDAQGFFCTTTPVFTSSTVSVVQDGQNQQIGYMPVQVYTQPGMPECQGGCSNVAVLRPYGAVTCAAGEVFFGNTPGSNVLVEVYDLNFPNTRVFSTMTEADGSYCAPVPGGVEVSVQVGAGAALCDAETVSTVGMIGQQCDEGGQGGECLQVPTLTCTQ
jgi:hypothetical protein